MIQRIAVLSGYLLTRLLWSLAGALYLILALVYYWLAFQQRTPEAGYFILIIALFGGAITFLVTLSVAARANEAGNATLLVRLPSRIEYLAATLVASLLFSFLLQGLVALLALITSSPALSVGTAIEIPPIWLAINILAAVMALHASDLVTNGWSRVYVYGTLALILFLQSNHATLSGWLAGRFLALSAFFAGRGWTTLSAPLRNMADWLGQEGNALLGQVTGFIFWPFQAIMDAAVAGHFARSQALAPAVLLLYATILFMIAADLFANKDLQLTE